MSATASIAPSNGCCRRLRRMSAADSGRTANSPCTGHCGERMARCNVKSSRCRKTNHHAWQPLPAAAMLDPDTDQFEDDTHRKRNRPNPNGWRKEHQQPAEDYQNDCNGAPDCSVGDHVSFRSDRRKPGFRRPSLSPCGLRRTYSGLIYAPIHSMPQPCQHTPVRVTDIDYRQPGSN